MKNFNLKNFLIENKLTTNSKELEEGKQPGADKLNAAIQSGKLDPKKIEDAAKKAQQGDSTELAMLMLNAMAGLQESNDDKERNEEYKGNEEWEGSINGLKKDDHPQGFAEMADIILSKYPDEGPSTYRMEVYHNNDGVATGASGGFAIDNGNVYFDFKFKDGKVVDYSFNEQNY